MFQKPNGRTKRAKKETQRHHSCNSAPKDITFLDIELLDLSSPSISLSIDYATGAYCPLDSSVERPFVSIQPYHLPDFLTKAKLKIIYKVFKNEKLSETKTH